MDVLSGGLPLTQFAIVCVITAFAGFVKGAVGFAMPMIMISAFASLLSPELALAGLVIPTLVTNIFQANRDGLAVFCATVLTWRRYLCATTLALIFSAQWAAHIPQGWFLLALGLPVTAFAAVRLAGLSLALPIRHRNALEMVSAIIGGLYGGVSGVWGPPLVVYLISIRADKDTMIRVQGTVFLIGAIVLFAAHLQTGLLNATTLPFSAVLVVPAMLGLLIGMRVQNRLDQARFTRWTYLLLGLTGLNLIRRAAGL